MKAFLINDTSNYHFGCRMVVKTIREQLDARDVELVGTAPSKHTFRRYRPVLDTVDLVIVNGEGSLHSGRRRDLFDVALEYPSVLINFSLSDYPDFPVDAAAAFKYVAARESISALEWAIEAHVIPDIVPELSLMQDVERLPPVFDIGCFDSVDTPKAERGEWKSPFEENFERMAQVYQRWVVGRLHMVCLAIILNKPFSAYATHTPKIEGLMKDACLSNRFYRTREEALDYVPDKPSAVQGAYLEHARKRIPQMFDEICSL